MLERKLSQRSKDKEPWENSKRPNRPTNRTSSPRRMLTSSRHAKLHLLNLQLKQQNVYESTVDSTNYKPFHVLLQKKQTQRRRSPSFQGLVKVPAKPGFATGEKASRGLTGFLCFLFFCFFLGFCLFFVPFCLCFCLCL